MRVNVLTPLRKGGPYNWGRDLAAHLNAGNAHQAAHLHSFPDLISAPARQAADLVHTAVPLNLRLWKKPVVLTVHGDYSVENNLWKLLYPWSVHLADAVTTPSAFLKERLCLDTAEVIPNAVYPDHFKPGQHSAGAVVNLVTVTKFYFEDKAAGVLDLLRIVEQVKRSTDLDLRLTVVGGGKFLDPILEKASAFDVPVHFTGFLDRPASALEQADLFVYYSTHDNFPITLLEAMASGLPIVSNEFGAIREIITSGREGYIARTPEEYAESLSRLIGDPGLRQRMGREARQAVEKKFSWDVVAGKYAKLYQRLVE